MSVARQVARVPRVVFFAGWSGGWVAVYSTPFVDKPIPEGWLTTVCVATLIGYAFLPHFYLAARRSHKAEWDRRRQLAEQEAEAYVWDALHEQYRKKRKTSWFVEVVRQEIFGGPDRLIRREGVDGEGT